MAYKTRVNPKTGKTEYLFREILNNGSERKIFIIRGADNMNDAAQNALLKSFEEPPQYAVIILLSENVKNLLPTIRSRGSRVEFEPFAEKEIYDLKHDLIANQIKTETAEASLKELEAENKDLLLNKARLEATLEDTLLDKK